MLATADRFFPSGPTRREVWLPFSLSVLFHGLLTAAVVFIPRFQIGTYLRVPVTYTVSLVEAPPGERAGGGPTAGPAPATPAPRPEATLRSTPRPAEELTLPGRRPAQRVPREGEPSLRPPSVTGREMPRPQSPAAAPRLPAAPAPPVADSGAGVGKGTGVEVVGTGTGAGTGGGSELAAYLTRLDWKIQQNWAPVGAAGAPETVVVVRFRVLRSGQVRDLELETSSGNAGMDASALRAVRQSLPLPPFPNLLTEPFLDLRYRFVMERG